MKARSREGWKFFDTRERSAVAREGRRPARAVLDGLADGVLVVADDGAIVEMNAAAEELFGAPLEALAGSSFARFLPDIAAFRPLNRLLEHSRSHGGVAVEATDFAGQTLRVHVSAGRSIIDSKMHYLLVVRRRDAGLPEARASGAERMSEIGSTMRALSHESRNALQRLQSCLTLIRLHGDEFALELVDDMQEALDQLHRLYEEVRNQAAPFQPERRTTDVRKLIERTWRLLGIRSRQKQIAWDLKLDGGGDTRAFADPRELRVAIRSLLEEAIEASPVGGTIVCAFTDNAIDAIDSATGDGGMAHNGSECERLVFELGFSTGDGPGEPAAELADAERIIEEQHGRLRVAPATRNMARVVVALPRSEAR